jgi:hypothetical protein
MFFALPNCLFTPRRLMETPDSVSQGRSAPAFNSARILPALIAFLLERMLRRPVFRLANHRKQTEWYTKLNYFINMQYVKIVISYKYEF